MNPELERRLQEALDAGRDPLAPANTEARAEADTTLRADLAAAGAEAEAIAFLRVEGWLRDEAAEVALPDDAHFEALAARIDAGLDAGLDDFDPLALPEAAFGEGAEAPVIALAAARAARDEATPLGQARAQVAEVPAAAPEGGGGRVPVWAFAAAAVGLLAFVGFSTLGGGAESAPVAMQMDEEAAEPTQAAPVDVAEELAALPEAEPAPAEAAPGGLEGLVAEEAPLGEALAANQEGVARELADRGYGRSRARRAAPRSSARGRGADTSDPLAGLAMGEGASSGGGWQRTERRQAGAAPAAAAPSAPPAPIVADEAVAPYPTNAGVPARARIAEEVDAEAFERAEADDVTDGAGPVLRPGPDDDDLFRAAERTRPRLRRCFEQASVGMPTAIVARVRVAGATGRVLRIRSLQPELSAAVVPCVERTVRAVRLAPFAGEQDLTIRFPL